MDKHLRQIIDRIFHYKHNSLTRIVVILFFLSLFLNIYSIYLHYKINFVANTKFTSMASLIWFTSLVLFGLMIFICFKKKKEKEDTNVIFNTYEKFYVLLILSLAIILRLYKLNFHGLYLDEWYWLSQARQVTDGTIISPFGFIGDQPSNMPVYPVAFLFTFLKDSYLAVRLPGVL